MKVKITTKDQYARIVDVVWVDGLTSWNTEPRREPLFEGA